MFKDLSFINNINSIALIGASKSRHYFFIKTLSESFKGKIYIIKPGVDSIEQYPNLPVYSRVTDIPDGETVDFAFIAIPRDQVKNVILDCLEKKVRLAAIFTANFADAGTEQGKRSQDELIELIHSSKHNMRILGPNGMGLYHPKIGLRWRPSLPLDSGDIGLVAQSGGLCNLLIHGLHAEGLYISKAFSIGNAADVTPLDAMHYLIKDPETSIIISYLEGIPKGTGNLLLKLLKSSNKPVIMVKGGRTFAGKRAAESHTASLVGNFKIWRQSIINNGGILVESFEDVVNTAKYLKHVKGNPGTNICLFSLSGGYGVICSDILIDHGLQLPDLARYEDLSELFDQLFSMVGVSLNNPVDIAAGLNEPRKIEQMLMAILEKDEMHTLIFEIAPFYMKQRFNMEIDLPTELVEMLTRVRNKTKRPVLVIIEHVEYEKIAAKMKQGFQKNNIPVFDDILPIARMLQFLDKSTYFK